MESYNLESDKLFILSGGAHKDLYLKKLFEYWRIRLDYWRIRKIWKLSLHFHIRIIENEATFQTTCCHNTDYGLKLIEAEWRIYASVN